MCYIQLLELRIDQLLCTEVKVNFDRANTPTGFFPTQTIKFSPNVIRWSLYP